MRTYYVDVPLLPPIFGTGQQSENFRETWVRFCLRQGQHRVDCRFWIKVQWKIKTLENKSRLQFYRKTTEELQHEFRDFLLESLNHESTVLHQLETSTLMLIIFHGISTALFELFCRNWNNQSGKWIFVSFFWLVELKKRQEKIDCNSMQSVPSNCYKISFKKLFRIIFL
jgi:hypothetical protein